MRVPGLSPPERSLLLAALAQRGAEERFRRIADTAPVMIRIADTAGACTWFNTPWLAFTGRPIERELGDGWASGLHEDDRERSRALYSDALRARAPFSMEYRLRRHDGVYRWLLNERRARLRRARRVLRLHRLGDLT